MSDKTIKSNKTTKTDKTNKSNKSNQNNIINKPIITNSEQNPVFNLENTIKNTIVLLKKLY